MLIKCILMFDRVSANTIAGATLQAEHCVPGLGSLMLENPPMNSLNTEQPLSIASTNFWAHS